MSLESWLAVVKRVPCVNPFMSWEEADRKGMSEGEWLERYVYHLPADYVEMAKDPELYAYEG